MHHCWKVQTQIISTLIVIVCVCVLSILCGNVDKNSPFDIYIYTFLYIITSCLQTEYQISLLYTFNIPMHTHYGYVDWISLVLYSSLSWGARWGTTLGTNVVEYKRGKSQKISTDFQNHIFWNGYNSCPKHQAIQMNYQLGAASWYKLPTQWLSGLFDTSIIMHLHSSLCSQTLYFLPGRWWVHLLSLCQYSN